MTLCSNREEGFGPSSQLASPLPTTCFIDTVINPLPVYLYLLSLPVAFLLSSYSQNQSSSTSTAYLYLTPRRPLIRKIITIAYYAAIVINVLMQTIEVVRLCLGYFGVGLLPFDYVGLVFGLIIHATDGLRGRIRGLFWKGLNTLLWTGMMIVSLVKIAGLVKLEDRGIYRTGTKYPITDWVTDVAVLAGFYLFLAVVEIFLGIWKKKGTVAGEVEYVSAKTSEK